MKKIIIILGTIILGVIIVNELILDDSGLKGSAKDIIDDCDKQIELIKIVAP
ncbi:hypothetical protein JYG23_09450 [Sedimentibacter sp. zth1]|uniref:hypothetical protein n=1 Tax=Sedimentibacter sp. zth1 TaxID=2816908 RepID=UPI001A92C3BD|nr:hypothetical protein [Sedimentibacter sp. zth1]QSX04916.1 hypothetical protein JYG23_09450 [Sedimentibacter sp. zth1]